MTTLDYSTMHRLEQDICTERIALTDAALYAEQRTNKLLRIALATESILIAAFVLIYVL